MNTPFDCIAGWGAFTTGFEPNGYQIFIMYDSPAATPVAGTAMTVTGIAKEYTAATMWSGGEFCPPYTLNASGPLMPSGYVLSGAACVSLGGVALLSPHDLLRFTFQANATGTFPVHMITFAQGGATIGSYTVDPGIPQTNTYVCAGTTCVASFLSTADNPTDPTITIASVAVGGFTELQAGGSDAAGSAAAYENSGGSGSQFPPLPLAAVAAAALAVLAAGGWYGRRSWLR